MALTKAELQGYVQSYDVHLEQALAAETRCYYHQAVLESVKSFPFIDGMMQYRRKYEEVEFKSVKTIDLVLKYAPLVFNIESLRQLETLLKSQKRIDRVASADLTEKCAQAIQNLWRNHRLWNHIEANPGARQDKLRTMLNDEQDYSRWVCERWDELGLVRREASRGSYCLSLTTRFESLVPAKCGCCGVNQLAPMSMFLETVKCPECGELAEFTLLDATKIS